MVRRVLLAAHAMSEGLASSGELQLLGEHVGDDKETCKRKDKHAPKLSL